MVEGKSCNSKQEGPAEERLGSRAIKLTGDRGPTGC